MGEEAGDSEEKDNESIEEEEGWSRESEAREGQGSGEARLRKARGVESRGEEGLEIMVRYG